MSDVYALRQSHPDGSEWIQDLTAWNKPSGTNPPAAAPWSGVSRYRGAQGSGGLMSADIGGTLMQHLRTPWIGDEIVGEHLPYDGRYAECPHDPDWRREIHSPVPFITESGVSHRRTFVCMRCRYEQTVRCPGYRYLT